MMKKDILICLDNGHGENTSGKRSPDNKLLEYKYAREIVKLVANKLAVLEYNVFVVTPELDDIRLSTRARRANNEASKYKHSLFISIHVNGYGNGDKWYNDISGWSCYTTKGQNNSDKLSECLYDAAEEILKPLEKNIQTERSDGDRDFEENFTVIYMANMPAVLSENFFMTNENDVVFLLSEQGKNTIADIHVKGIEKFINEMNWMQK